MLRVDIEQVEVGLNSNEIAVTFSLKPTSLTAHTRRQEMEFFERMQAEGECFVAKDRPSNPQIWPPTSKKVALDMIAEADVDLYFYTWASGVLKNDGAIQGVITQSIGNYIAPSGEVTFLIYCDKNDKATYHDYMRLTVQSAPFRVKPKKR